MGCSIKTVALWIRKHADGRTENLKDHRKNNHAPQKTTVEQNEELIRAVDENPFDPVVNVIRNRGLNICAETARRRLRAAGVHYRPAAKKIELKPRHGIQRLQFAKEHLEGLKKSGMLLSGWTRKFYLLQKGDIEFGDQLDQD